MFLRPGEEIETWIERENQCDYRLDEPDELKDFFSHVPGRLRDAFTPYATQWQDPPPFNHSFWKGYIDQRNWLDKAIAILTSLAHQHNVPVAPFRYLTRLIHGEMPRDSHQCRVVVDAVRDIHLAIFGTDGEYVLIWDREEDNIAGGDQPTDGVSRTIGGKWEKLYELLQPLGILPRTKEQRKPIRIDYNSRFGNKPDDRGGKWPMAEDEHVRLAVKYLNDRASKCS